VLDPASRTAAVCDGVELDLGATARALCADRAAARITAETGAGTLVDLGGDLATAGPPPPGGWNVEVAALAGARRPGDDDGCVVSLWRGALASSHTADRATLADRTPDRAAGAGAGRGPEPVWRCVTVAAGTCVEAGTAASAALFWGADAPFRLAHDGLAARLVRSDGSVVEVGGWPIADPPRRAQLVSISSMRLPKGSST
jgi:thiamine biosynthesis lipoprotein